MVKMGSSVSMKSSNKSSKKSSKKVQFAREPLTGFITTEVQYTYPAAPSERGEIRPPNNVCKDTSLLVGESLMIHSLNKREPEHIVTVQSSDGCFINVLDNKGKKDRYHVLKNSLYNVYSKRYCTYMIVAANYFEKSETYDRRQIKRDYPRLKRQILEKIRIDDYEAWQRITQLRYKRIARNREYRRKILQSI